jgi:kanosamine 6-kinase
VRAAEGFGAVAVLLGVDVGGTKVAIRLEHAGTEHAGTEHAGVGPDGADPDSAVAEHTMTWPAGATVREDLAAFGRWLRARLAKQPAPTAVGVAMPATCDAGGTVVAWPGRPSWIGLNLRAALGTLFGEIASAWADDGDLAALAEADHAGCREVVYVGVGTGVGGGIIRDGRVWPGPDRGSCELGHLIVDMSGPRCDCGRHGCLQSLASAPATLRRAADLRGREVTPADFAAGVAGGAAWAEAALTPSVAALAAAVVGVSELAHPDVVLIGGGFGAGIPGLAQRIARAAEPLRRRGRPPLDIRRAALGPRSSLVGAVLLARTAAQ